MTDCVCCVNRYNDRTKSYQDEVPEAVRALASGASVMRGPYDAMGSGDALAVRELIERHRDKMLTIRRRDFEVRVRVRLRLGLGSPVGLG